MPVRPLVALATCSVLPELNEDGPALLAALDRAGLRARPAVWDDPGEDWSAYDLVVLRTVWDYFQRLPQFLDWVSSVPRLANPAPVVRWNTDKRYLRELAAAGLPVVRTTWLDPGDAFFAPAGEYVVKPVVSAGARDTARYRPGEDEAAGSHVAALLGAGRPVMVQPYLDGVDAAGETALLCFDGRPSHAARKAALLRPGVGVDNDIDSRAFVTPAVPSDAQLGVASAVLAAVPWGEPLLYARVDLVPGPDGSPVLLELEVTEPSLFLRHAEGAVDRFAAAVARAVRRVTG